MAFSMLMAPACASDEAIHTNQAAHCREANAVQIMLTSEPAVLDAKVHESNSALRSGAFSSLIAPVAVPAEFATKAVDRTVKSNGQRGLNGEAPY
jgi:hypothetical protein